MINVILVDDEKIIRHKVKMILSSDNEINVLDEAKNGKHLLDILDAGTIPDVILMDIKMPIMNGLKATKIVKEKYNKIKIIVLTAFNKDKYIFYEIKNNADGYLLKDSEPYEIIKAIKTAFNGNITLTPEVATKIVKAFNSLTINFSHDNLTENREKLKLLTKREIDIANLVAQGKNNKDISNALFLTEGTVKNYLTKIFDKLEINGRTELALLINHEIQPTIKNLD